MEFHLIFSLSNLFKAHNHTSYSLELIYYDKDYDPQFPDKDNFQVGFSIIKLFDQIQFNFYERNINYYSNQTGLLIKRNNLSKNNIIKIIVNCSSTLLLVFICILGVKFVNINKTV